jgi:hypothetical protein
MRRARAGQADRLSVGIAQLLLLLAAFAYVLLAVAEQGSIGSELSETPSRPLPFERARVFGLDLTDRTSFDALQWLQNGDWDRLALISIPVDAEIVASLTVEERAVEAVAALDTLINAADPVPVIICFHKPVSPRTDAALAEIAVNQLRDRYTQRVAYVSACSGAADRAWQDALATELGVTGASAEQLVPLSVGASAAIEDISGVDALRSSNLRAFSGSSYVMPRLTVRQPLDTFAIRRGQTAVRDAAQIALVLLRPGPDLDPNTFARSVDFEPIAVTPLPEGFTAVASLTETNLDGWESTSIGTNGYIRAASAGAQLRLEFIGTELFAYALRSPTAGALSVWIDRAPGALDTAPDSAVDLKALQARDAAVALVSGLPADRHTVTLVIDEDEVVLSGFFVSGKPEAVWSAALADVGLIAIAIGAGAVVARTAVKSIRRRTLASDADGPVFGG